MPETIIQPSPNEEGKKSKLIAGISSEINENTNAPPPNPPVDSGVIVDSQTKIKNKFKSKKSIKYIVLILAIVGVICVLWFVSSKSG